MSVNRDPVAGDRFTWGREHGLPPATVLAVADGAVLYRYDNGHVNGCTVDDWLCDADLLPPPPDALPEAPTDRWANVYEGFVATLALTAEGADGSYLDGRLGRVPVVYDFDRIVWDDEVTR